MAIVEGADGFQWEQNIGEEKKPLAGGAHMEWWREVQTSTPDQWWRITREYDDSGKTATYFLRLWEKDKGTGKVVLKSSGFASIDTHARAQEDARRHEMDQVS